MHETSYIRDTPQSHRKEYGQFFTPVPVARLMLKWIIDDNTQNILDPAFGLGIFYDEIMNLFPDRKIHFSGYEIDNHILDYYNHNGKTSNLVLNKLDYLESDVGLFDGIVCNPPYMRFQKFLKRHNILPKIEDKVGKKLVGYSNISSIFLIKSLQELKINGKLAYIMPFEFFNTGYGKEIKKSLLENHLLKQIIIFSNEKEIFPDAITTVCVLLCQNDGIQSPIRLSVIESSTEIDEITDVTKFYQREIRTSDLPYNEKWSPIILSLFTEEKQPNGFCKISNYGMFTRGIATGANDFFALSKSKIEKWHLDTHNICKCITKSSHLRKSIFEEDDFNLLYQKDKPVYCLDVKDIDNVHVSNYLAEGERLGYHQRYLTKTRNTWYKIENRKPAPILFGVFQRGRLKVIRNYTSSINFTCFHSFYPNLFGEHIIDKLFIYFLSGIGQKIIKSNKRSYGDGLDKFEPGDLNESLCPNETQFEMIDESEVKKVFNLLEENEEEAIQMSNFLIKKILDSQTEVFSKSLSPSLYNY